jgi:hypothetical protein
MLRHQALDEIEVELGDLSGQPVAGVAAQAADGLGEVALAGALGALADRLDVRGRGGWTGDGGGGVDRRSVYQLRRRPVPGIAARALKRRAGPGSESPAPSCDRPRS